MVSVAPPYKLRLEGMQFCGTGSLAWFTPSSGAILWFRLLLRMYVGGATVRALWSVETLVSDDTFYRFQEARVCVSR